MQIHNLKRKTQNKKPMIVGRGGKRGKTSGRGGKGQSARAGNKIRPEIRDMIKKLPKLRGYAFNSVEDKLRPMVVVNLSSIEQAFDNGSTVKPSTLVSRGVLEQYKGKNPRVKILADGNVTKKLNIVNCVVSVKTKEKIEKAGGSIK
jgi:large subunit ribosomal protein L15